MQCKPLDNKGLDEKKNPFGSFFKCESSKNDDVNMNFVAWNKRIYGICDKPWILQTELTEFRAETFGAIISTR